MTPKLIYIAGPYRAKTPWLVEQNIRAAEEVGAAVVTLGAGAYPIIPHTNTRGYFEALCDDAEYWLGATLELMRRCDGVLTMETWRESSGATAERKEALRLGIPVFKSLGDLEHVLFNELEHWEPLQIIRPAIDQCTKCGESVGYHKLFTAETCGTFAEAAR